MPAEHGRHCREHAKTARNLFELQDLGANELKGSRGLCGPRGHCGREFGGEPLRGVRTATTPLVGRDEEIDLLMRRWEQAKAGDGCVVLISGEPGIGKSRIAETIVERLSSEPHTRLRYFCSPYHQDSALYPAIAQLERAAGFRREDTAEQRLDKLEAVLAQATNDISEVAPLFADLLSIPTGDRYPALNLTPQKRKEKTLAGAGGPGRGTGGAAAGADGVRGRPLERPHHAGIARPAHRAGPTVRVLVIITFRPEFTPPWVGRPHVTLLSSQPSAAPAARRDDRGVTGGKALPKEIADHIADRTDGVPLFIEELTKSVVESGLLVAAGDQYR